MMKTHTHKKSIKKIKSRITALLLTHLEVVVCEFIRIAAGYYVYREGVRLLYMTCVIVDTDSSQTCMYRTIHWLCACTCTCDGVQCALCVQCLF